MFHKQLIARHQMNVAREGGKDGAFTADDVPEFRQGE